MGEINKNNSNLFIAGDDLDTLWFAPMGTTFPEKLTLPEASDPWSDIGLLSEDGITIGRDTSVEDFRAHQGVQVRMTKISESTRQLTVTVLEDNEYTRSLIDDVMDETTDGDVTTTVTSGESKIHAKAVMLDVYSQEQQRRYCWPRMDITVSGEETLSKSDLTGVELTFKQIGGMTRHLGPRI